MSNLKHPHQKYIATFVFATDNSVRQYTFGGGGRICTAVHDNIQTTSTNFVIAFLRTKLQKEWLDRQLKSLGHLTVLHFVLVCKVFSNICSLFHPITYYDTCQGIYAILPGSIFCPL